MIIHMYSAGVDKEGRVVLGRPGDKVEVPSGHRSCGAPIGYPCTCPTCVGGFWIRGWDGDEGGRPR